MPDEPVVLSGPPDGLSGRVPYHNDTGATVTITQVGVDAPDDPTPRATVAVDEVTVPPGAEVLVRLRLQVAPSTPPGAYPLVLTVADTSVPATAQVVASPRLRVTPPALVLDGLSADAVATTVVVTNEGNVALRLPSALSVPVHREDLALPTLAALVRDAPDELDLVTPLPDEPAGTVDVSIDDAGEVAPGTTRICTCTFSVAAPLASSTRHVGALPLSIGTVLLVLPPDGTGPDDPA